MSSNKLSAKTQEVLHALFKQLEDPMRLTPMDIETIKFRRFSALDEAEVMNFLNRVKEDMQLLFTEVDLLETKLSGAEKQVEALKSALKISQDYNADTKKLIEAEIQRYTVTSDTTLKESV